MRFPSLAYFGELQQRHFRYVICKSLPLLPLLSTIGCLMQATIDPYQSRSVSTACFQDSSKLLHQTMLLLSFWLRQDPKCEWYQRFRYKSKGRDGKICGIEAKFELIQFAVSSRLMLRQTDTGYRQYHLCSTPFANSYSRQAIDCTEKNLSAAY